MRRILLISLVVVFALQAGWALAQPAVEPFETIDAASQEILAREPVTERAVVKHILVGWDVLAPNYGGQMDPRAAARPRAQADEIALMLLNRVRNGEAIEPLMAEFSEDPGSAASGEGYTATPDAGLVAPFKALSLRLQVGETGLVMTAFGWHIIKRVE